MDSVIETIMNRRSVRVFDGRTVPDADLATILEAANNAPSAHNRQPWRFIVLRGGKKDELAALVGGSSANYPKSAGALMRMAGRSIFTAPVAVAVVATAERGGEDHASHTIDEVISADVARMMDVQSAAAAIQNMLLAASACGVSSVWVGVVMLLRDEIMNFLGERRGELVAVVPFGYGAKTGGAPRKQPLAGKVSYL